jgi:hypothetical protein
MKDRFRVARINLFFFLLGCLLSGCAAVTAVPVSPTTGQEIPNAVDGIPYFLPAPYLLVMEVPNEPPAPKAGGGGAAAGGAAPPAAPAPTTPGDKKSTDDGSGTAPSPTTDTSFSMFTKQYGVKLIYLPDYSHPMVLRQRAGIGSTTLKPTLQNGWMLTGLDSSADSKVAETISSVGSILGATHGSGGSGSSTPSKAGGGSAGVPVVPPVLPPGLYRLYFDPATHVLSKICQVARFTDQGVEDPKVAQRCP